MTTYVYYGTEYLSKRLREHRKRLGLTLSCVSRAASITIEDLEQYECGHKVMTIEELSRIADLYKVSPSYFVGGISV